ncbi:MAG TPA: nucleoside triphosphate pyrophosphohydrolase, partial [Candidatus Limnocylindrales bacterium]|nr:nucleoside triphosphate pyrophosphohydrolase [Candidatus Limnocylindrales bacterium]
MGRIVVVGLGSGSRKHLTGAAWQVLISGCPVYFRTGGHALARSLAAHGSKVRFFDYLYRSCDDFNQVYHKITNSLISASRRNRVICYAVPGHPSVGEAVVERLRKLCPKIGIQLQLVAGLSFLEPVLECLKVDLLEGVTVHDALLVDRLKEPCHSHLILAQAYSRSVASRVKLKLLELYPPSFPVTIIRAAGTHSQRVWRIPLHSLDHKSVFNHQTTLYLPPVEGCGIGDLVSLIAKLCSEDGCPWDKQQTNASLRQNLVEEAYEVVSAIDEQNDRLLLEELGDVLMQVVFHSQIAAEENRFDLNQVIRAIVSKLIRRHPHVFGSEKLVDISQVRSRWEQIKSEEKNRGASGEILSIDHSLPALLKAYKVQRRSSELGFDWPSVAGALEKAREEITELEEACQKKDQMSIEEELG